MLDGGVEYWGRGENPFRGHGSPYDRGSADSYYGRPKNPHYYRNPRGHDQERVKESDMSDYQIEEYYLGYEDNEKQGHKKNWG